MEGTKNKDKLNKDLKIYRIKLFFLYFILIMGGVWYHLELFQEVSQFIAGYLIIAIGIFSVLEVYKNVNIDQILRFISIILFIILISWVVELIGVKTGLIFGNYKYGSILQPQILGTPIPIGFAWISTLLGSYAITQIILKKINSKFVILIFTAFLMTLFDFMMEPAAIKLGYWYWESGTVPIQNYLAWFVIGFFFALLFSTQKINLLNTKILKHVYLSQVIYFFIIYLKLNN